MEAYKKGSMTMNAIRRHSQSVLHDLLIRGFKEDIRETHPGGQRGTRPMTPRWHQSLDSVFTRKGSHVLLDGNNTLEFFKPRMSRPPALREQLSDMFLPAMTGTTSNLQAARGKLSHSCPYLNTIRRRGSTSSISSHRGPDFNKQSFLKAQKESKKSNVCVTMMYLGQGLAGSNQDEMKVLQQICGGENICVFKGFVKPGEQFQFISQRHLGFPFSATIFVNGLMAARISSCCEYRYNPGFQQGRRSIFRLTRLNGGKPCYKCVNSRHGIGTPTINNPGTALMQAIIPHEDTVESCPSSPLFIPLGMERSVQKTRKLSKDGGALSSDSDDMIVNIKERHHKRHKGPHHQRGKSKTVEESQTLKDEEKSSSYNIQQVKTFAREQKDKDHGKKAFVPDSLQEIKPLTKHEGKKETVPRNGKNRNNGRLRDFFEECVEMSTGLESGLDQQRWFKVNKSERNKVKDLLTSGNIGNGSTSEVELSTESDSDILEASKPKLCHQTGSKDDTSEQDLQKQSKHSKNSWKYLFISVTLKNNTNTDTKSSRMEVMAEMLTNSDEVEQLILRNTGLTDKLLLGLARALKSSPSEVTVINLNLNQIGPPGVAVLLDLLQAKPHIKELLLFGNQLGDLGVQTLLSGLAELQDKKEIQCGYSKQIPCSLVSIAIKELDLGGNGIGGDGLKVLATFMRYHSQLQYLGLAQTFCSDMEAWTALFESLRGNTVLEHIILDESNLGDDGIKLFAETLKINKSLKKVELDNNGCSDVAGNSLLDALISRGKGSLEELSLDGNLISTALMMNLQQELEFNRPATL